MRCEENQVLFTDRLVRAVDWFVPDGLQKSTATLWQARIFVISHFLGPFSAVAIMGYLYRALTTHDEPGGENYKSPGGSPCVFNTDCLSGTCQIIFNTCTTPAGCADALKDNAETDVDCGGPQCAKCVVGKLCGQASDCATNLCGKVTLHLDQ